MSKSIHNGLTNYLRRYLVSHRRLNAVSTGSYSKVNLGEYKINCLIYQLENRSLVNPIKGDRFGNLSSMEMGTLHFRGNKETLRLFAKEQDCCVAWSFLVKEI